MSKVLIIFSHPSHGGHNGYLLQQITSKLDAKKTEYEIIDLYAINYNPVLQNSELYSSNRRALSPENEEMQIKIKNAKYLIFIYPTWWQGPPAILKGFIDRVFTGSFAFTYKNGLPHGLLPNKKAAIFTSSGSPKLIYSLFFGSSSLKFLSKNTLPLCGIKCKGFHLGSARKLENNKNKLDKISHKIIKYLK